MTAKFDSLQRTASVIGALLFTVMLTLASAPHVPLA